MHKLYILTGGVRTGKTTALEAWCAAGEGRSGILQPVRDGVRMLLDIDSGEERRLDATGEEAGSETIGIGRYMFKRDTLEWGKEKLIETARRGPRYLVLDELGYLEMEQKGMHDTFLRLLQMNRDLAKTTLLVVIREALLKSVMHHFNLEFYQPQILNINELPDE